MDYRTMKKKNAIVFVAIALIVIVVVMIIIALTHGDMTVKNSGSITKVKSLRCESEQVKYPFYNDSADKRMMRINIVMSDNGINSVSLVYRLYYDNLGEEMISRYTTGLQSTISESFGADGLKTNALNVTYSTFSDSTQMTLYTEARDINNVTKKYFLLEDIKDNYKVEDISKKYRDKGLICNLSE